MKKLRSDSKWQTIPPKAREEVIRWLFNEGMSYKAALQKAEQEFGIKSSKSSLARFYSHVTEERVLAGLNLPPVSPEDFRAVVEKLVGAAALNAGMKFDGPEVGKRFIPLVKLMLKTQAEELRTRRLDFDLLRSGLRLSTTPKI